MLNNIGVPGLLPIVVETILLFGRGKITSFMGELGGGLTAFKRGLRGGDDDPDEATHLTTPRPVSDKLAEKGK